MGLDLAREIAAREGVNAIVDGTIRSLAGGYAISLRLVTADSLDELALYQETANGPQEILESIDKLIREIYASPPDVVKRAMEIER